MASQPNLSGSRAAAICNEADELREALKFVQRRLTNKALALRELATPLDKEAASLRQQGFRNLAEGNVVRAQSMRTFAGWCEAVANAPDVWDGIGADHD